VKLTHIDEKGQARMVNVGNKPETARIAVARGEVLMAKETFGILKAGQAQKGDVLGVARTAGIMSAKQTCYLIPLCHPLQITSASVEFNLDETRHAVEIEARVTTFGRTGAEMEALTAVSVAGLTIYDMLKAVDREMIIENIRLIQKSGGKSGTFRRKGEDCWGSQEGS
jgi:cyclic pyranopterin phosphate synthase